MILKMYIHDANLIGLTTFKYEPQQRLTKKTESIEAPVILPDRPNPRKQVLHSHLQCVQC